MEQNYLVTWEMDICAETPREAAEKAWEHMRAQGSTANVFAVIDKNGAKTVVDLEEQQP